MARADKRVAAFLDMAGFKVDPETVGGRLNWDAARKRDYVREHGSVRAEPERNRRASKTYLHSRWNSRCKLCSAPVPRRAKYYSLRPGVICVACAKAFIGNGSLPADPASRKGKLRLESFRQRLANGDVQAPVRRVKQKAARVAESNIEMPPPARPIPEADELIARMIAQEARLKDDAKSRLQSAAKPGRSLKRKGRRKRADWP